MGYEQARAPPAFAFCNACNGLLRDVCDNPSRSFTRLQVVDERGTAGADHRTCPRQRVFGHGSTPRQHLCDGRSHPVVAFRAPEPCGDRGRLAPLRGERRRHAVPDLRLALGLATPHRRADRRDARGRDRQARRSNRVPAAARGRARHACAPPHLPRRGTVRLQRAAAAPDFSTLVGANFPALWSEIGALLQATPALRHDTIALTKMPAVVGAQKNPMLSLAVHLNPSGAYEMALGTDWETFYTGKRSSATRRRDRTKLKKLGRDGRGEVRQSGHAGGNRRFARNADRAEEQAVRPHGRAGHLRAAGLRAVLPRARRRPQACAHQPHRRRRRQGRDQSSASHTTAATITCSPPTTTAMSPALAPGAAHLRGTS